MRVRPSARAARAARAFCFSKCVQADWLEKESASVCVRHAEWMCTGFAELGLGEQPWRKRTAKGCRDRDAAWEYIQWSSRVGKREVSRVAVCRRGACAYQTALGEWPSP
jgi:hypothetical protein